MKTSEIKKLVEAFYNGETTIEEEKLLLSYFQGEDVAEELLKEKDLFLNLYQSCTILRNKFLNLTFRIWRFIHSV